MHLTFVSYKTVELTCAVQLDPHKSVRLQAQGSFKMCKNVINTTVFESI